jgi:hypothetical protein
MMETKASHSRTLSTTGKTEQVTGTAIDFYLMEREDEPTLQERFC